MMRGKTIALSLQTRSVGVATPFGSNCGYGDSVFSPDSAHAEERGEGRGGCARSKKREKEPSIFRSDATLFFCWLSFAPFASRLGTKSASAGR